MDLTGLALRDTLLRGDLDRDGDNDYFDFKLFKSAYNLTNGAGEFEQLLPVPEPQMLVLVGATLPVCWRARPMACLMLPADSFQIPFSVAIRACTNSATWRWLFPRSCAKKRVRQGLTVLLKFVNGCVRSVPTEQDSNSVTGSLSRSYESALLRKL